MRARWLLLCLGLAAGCVTSDPLGHRDALEDAQRRYTNMIRWRDAEKAVQFVDPELREQFLAHAKALDLLDISDYDIGEIEYDEEDQSATVEVTYRGYSRAHLIEREVRVTQEWHRKEGNDWRVAPDLELVVAKLKGEAP
jgi:hypothetical protein